MPVDLDHGRDLGADGDANKEKVVCHSTAVPASSDEEKYSMSVSDELQEPSSEWPFAQRLLKWGVELRGQRYPWDSLRLLLNSFMIFVLRNSPNSNGKEGRDPIQQDILHLALGKHKYFIVGISVSSCMAHQG